MNGSQVAARVKWIPCHQGVTRPRVTEDKAQKNGAWLRAPFNKQSGAADTRVLDGQLTFTHSS